MPGYDQSLLPIPAMLKREWFQQDRKTRNHAHHCQPLMMANSCGYFLLSPAHFTVTWDGDPGHDADLEIHYAASHSIIDTHSAFGSFTVQTQFVARTDNVGDFVWIKNIPNERDLPFLCMEAMVEAWWNPAQFGLVFLIKRAGSFTVNLGEPIAQMVLYKAAGGFASLETSDELPEEHLAHVRRPTHIVSWRKGEGFDE
jgi:hypothetical protein